MSAHIRKACLASLAASEKVGVTKLLPASAAGLLLRDTGRDIDRAREIIQWAEGLAFASHEKRAEHLKYLRSTIDRIEAEERPPLAVMQGGKP